jgi:hypothetical protein
MKALKTIIILMAVIILLNGCAGHVPGEVLDLSNTMGEDLKALHHSYRQLIIAHFDSLRKQTDSFMENQWLPVFIKDFIERGNLVQMVQAPPDGQRDTNVTEWVAAALEAINEKRNQLMKPLDEEERKLLEMVDSSFNLLNQANAKIYSHLKSLSKVEESTQGLFDLRDLKGLREKIDSGLAAAAASTAGMLQKTGKTGNPGETTSSTQTEQKNN